MKKQSLILLAAVCCSTNLLSGCRTAPRAEAWQYWDTFLTKGESLNQLASQGWIVVNAYYESENKSTHYLLKRLKSDKTAAPAAR